MKQTLPGREERATDAQLVAATRNGNLDAFQQLITRYQRRLFGLCYRLLGRHHDAEDASQEALLRAYRALDRYDPGRPFDRWLLTIAARCCVSMLRRRRSPEPQLDQHHQAAEAHLAHNSPGPPAQAQAREFAQAVAGAVAALPDPYRLPFVLFHQEEMTYDEISQALDLPPGTVKSRVHRARKHLYRHLSEAGFLDEENRP